MKLESLHKGFEIINEGEVCDKIYFIIDGEVIIRAHDNENEFYAIESLYKGGIIG